jgi:hypothetical protein
MPEPQQEIEWVRDAPDSPVTTVREVGQSDADWAAAFAADIAAA